MFAQSDKATRPVRDNKKENVLVLVLVLAFMLSSSYRIIHGELLEELKLSRNSVVFDKITDPCAIRWCS